MKTKITFLVASLLLIWSCTSNNDETYEADNQNSKKINAYLLIPSTKDTLYYEDLSHRNFYSSEENVALIKDILDNPTTYGLKSDKKFNDETIYTNSTGFLIKKSVDSKNNSSRINTNKTSFDTNSGIFEIDGEATLCDGLMGMVTEDVIKNDCSNGFSIDLMRTRSGNDFELANISFISASDNVSVYENYYIVRNATVYTWSSSWVSMFKLAMGVDGAGCIQRLQ